MIPVLQTILADPSRDDGHDAEGRPGNCYQAAIASILVMDEVHGNNWSLYNGDSAEVLTGLPDHSVDLALFSPPFSSTYTYSPSERDLGNVSSDRQFWDQFSWISRELLRVVKPGRLVAMHVAGG